MAAVRSALRPADKGLREAVQQVDERIREVKADADLKLKQLEVDKATLERMREGLHGASVGKPKRKRAVKKDHDHFVRLAGRKNVERVAGYLEQRGRAFQSEITRDLKLASGNVSHALRALASYPEGPAIRVTGRKERNSKEYEWMGRKAGADEVQVDEEQREPVAA